MNIKTKLTFSIGVLVALIVLLVALSVMNLQILTATEPDSPAAGPGLNRALLWVAVTGVASLCVGFSLLLRIPKSIDRPVKELKEAIREVANHNYTKRLDFPPDHEFGEVSEDFNRMVKRLSDYHSSTLAEMKSAKRYMETVIDSIDEPIMALGTDMGVLYANNEFLNVLNMDREAVVGESSTELSLRNDLLRKLVRELVESNVPQAAAKKEPLKIYADNKESYFQVKYISIAQTNSVGETKNAGYVIMLKNITEFKELDSAKTTFISTVSHELKTPISAILMSLQLLEDKRLGPLNEERRELAEEIRENGQRLLDITGELLNISQVESGKLKLKPKVTKPIELIDYAIKANRVQAERFNVQIEVDYPEKIRKLFVDCEKIAWVLTNLLSNAVRYSSDCGRAVIGAYQPDDSHVCIYVRDFGKGIDKRYHQSIFEPYFRVPGTKLQGSGLGLSISRDFVNAHGGELAVESEIGKGSIFTVTLPA